MESLFTENAVTFKLLQARLIRFVNNRISNGDFSERGLARAVRVSQPYIHKVLKGERKLTPDLADRFLGCFELSVWDLTEDGDKSLGLKPTRSAQPATPKTVATRRELLSPEIANKSPRRRRSSIQFRRTKSA